MSNPGSLARRLGTGDAVVIGMGSMIGAGVFAVFTPAAQAAGAGLLLGLVLAAMVAYANAMASAQLAAQYPTSGGSYLYGRERLGPWWGFAAGWGFVIGKTASCAAMAMTFAAHLVPVAWQRPMAVAAVVVLTAVDYHGITRTARLTRIIVSIALTSLVVVALAGLLGAAPGRTALGAAPQVRLDWLGVLQSAGLLFFAFAGYARVATLGEEVRDPQRTIPRAIRISLALTVLIYLVTALAVLGSIGSAGAAAGPAPLLAVVEAARWGWAVPLVQVGAAAASLGALLALIAGVGRTALAMARNHDLPGQLGAVHPRHRVPHRADLTLAVLVIALILLGDLRGAIGFSSFGVLLYYFVANVAAYTQDRPHRRMPRGLHVAGALGCLVLLVTLPAQSVAAGLLVVAAGFVVRAVRLRRHRAV